MRKLAIGLLLLSLTACGAAGPSTGSDSTGSAPASTMPSPSASAASGDSSVSGSPGTDLMGSLGELEKNVITALSTEINKPADSLTLQNKEEVEWSNGALGCPKPDMMYTEMIVPGYKLTYSDGTQTYEVHTDRTGQQAIWCDKGDPKPLGG
ncbi:MAG TPA: hypothetical protein VFZ66_00270 [Herpetosiphonaceae bacterium]